MIELFAELLSVDLSIFELGKDSLGRVRRGPSGDDGNVRGFP